MLNSDIRFKVDMYNYSPQKIDFTDMLGINTKYPLTGTILSDSNIEGLVSIYNGSSWIYGRTEYLAYNFATPDITKALGWKKSAIGITIPTSLVSSWKFDYKFRIKIAAGNAAGGDFYLCDAVTAPSGTTSMFNIKSANLTSLIGTSPTNVYLQAYDSTGLIPAQTGQWLITSTVLSVGGDTEITCAATGGLAYTPAATDIFYIVFETEKTYDYKISTPTSSVTIEHECLTSQLWCTDSSVYTITDNAGVTHTTLATTRGWTITYPASVKPAVTSAFNPVVIGNGTTYNSGANIYRGTYGVVLVSVNNYNLELQTAGLLVADYYWLNLYTSLTYTDNTHSVACSSCRCTYNTCLNQIQTLYDTAVTNGDADTITRMLSAMERLSYLEASLSRAEACGEDTTTWCEKIKLIADAVNCQCSSTVVDNSEVIPLATIYSNSGTGGQMTYFRTCADGFYPTPSTNDICEFTDSGSFGTYTITKGDVYQWNGSTWQPQTNRVGAAGVGSTPVLYSSVTPVSDTNIGQETLKSYALTGDTFKPDNSEIEITARFKLLDTYTSVFMLYWDTTMLTQAFTVVATGDTYIELYAKVKRDSNSAISVMQNYKIFGTPDVISTYQGTQSITSLNLSTTTYTLKAVINASGGVAGQVTCQYFEVKLLKSV